MIMVSNARTDRLSGSTIYLSICLLCLLLLFIKGTYSSACGPSNLLRCEPGDLSRKHAPVMVGGGRQLYNDANLPMFGRNSGNDESGRTRH